MADDPARHNESVGVDRVCRVGTYDHVARRRKGLGEVCEALLRPHGGDHFGIRIEPDPEAPLIVARHRAPQAWDPFRRRITTRFWIPRGFNQLIDNMPRGRHVGISHTEIDYVHALKPQARFEAVHLLKHIGRQATDPVKFRGHSAPPLLKRQILAFAGRVTRSCAVRPPAHC